MSIEIKNKLARMPYVYGPLTKEEAFTVNVPSTATLHDGVWYAGTYEEYEPLADKLIIIEEPIIEQPIVEEVPAEQPSVE